MALNLFVKRVHKLLVKQKFHCGDKQTYADYSAYNALRKEKADNTCENKHCANYNCKDYCNAD
ncbi:MAG: glutathione S-transferase family protein [Eubacterium sp.]